MPTKYSTIHSYYRRIYTETVRERKLNKTLINVQYTLKKKNQDEPLSREFQGLFYLPYTYTLELYQQTNYLHQNIFFYLLQEHSFNRKCCIQTAQQTKLYYISFRFEQLHYFCALGHNCTPTAHSVCILICYTHRGHLVPLTDWYQLKYKSNAPTP